MSDKWIVVASTVDGRVVYSIGSHKLKRDALKHAAKFNEWQASHGGGKFALVKKIGGAA